MEGVIAGVVDAVVVCWASEVGSARSGAAGNGRGGEARYCREAGWLFGDERVVAVAGAGGVGDVEGEAGRGRDASRGQVALP